MTITAIVLTIVAALGSLIWRLGTLLQPLVVLRLFPEVTRVRTGGKRFYCEVERGGVNHTETPFKDSDVKEDDEVSSSDKEPKRRSRGWTERCGRASPLRGILRKLLERGRG